MASKKIPRLKQRAAAAKRSANMRAIKSRDTKPELVVRKLLTRLGYRYQLHSKALPGCPDLAFPGRRAVIFVHGCFWHRHSCKRGRSLPSTNSEFWVDKLQKNAQRDKLQLRKLRSIGWRTLVVWQCQLGEEHRMARRVRAFLERKP